jgi:soluble lytic murein transglycosylase
MNRTAWCIAMIVPVGVMVLLSCWQITGTSAPLPTLSGNATTPSFQNEVPVTRLSLPIVLSQKDRTLYQAIARAQKKGDWKKADANIAQLTDTLLVGTLLAQRYLDKHYKAAPAQLAEWLNQYADHPQAYDIYNLAVAKESSLREKFPAIRRPSVIQGYGDDTGLAARSGDNFADVTWRQAISAWRNGNKTESARLFATIANHPETSSSWQVSASAYWAWRSHKAIGNKKEAGHYLRLAAKQPRSFYGILARRQLGQSLSLDREPVTLSESDVLEMIGEPAIRRVIALAQSNLSELAEKELRILFPKAEESEKLRLLALARHFNMASVQISMAKHLDGDGRTYDYAKYPVPRWQPQDGFKVEPPLIYALMRQESGFHAAAISPAGALGVMQLMPRTASLMHQRINDILRDNGQPLLVGNVSDPDFNMMLGQNYVRHLLENNLVEGNLFYMLAAYNAGPGRLQEWKKTLDYHDDPLLFVESIPYAQTRHYVMQVMTSYWIYSELADETPHHSLQALLSGHWPNYATQSVQAMADSAI